MDYNIRKQVLSNLKNATFDDVNATINDAVSLQSDDVLPGLGVMLELAWKQGNTEIKNHIVNGIQEAVKQ